jgi:hypothetical protein
MQARVFGTITLAAQSPNPGESPFPFSKGGRGWGWGFRSLAPLRFWSKPPYRYKTDASR